MTQGGEPLSRQPTALEERKTGYEIELLQEKIRVEKARAAMAEIDLAVVRDKERDRQAKPGLTRRVNFFGDVSPASVDEFISALDHWASRDPGSHITITFNTSGGSVTDGLALYDTIQRMRRAGHTFTTRATGIAASMGAVLLQAGDERVMDARAKLLIHEGSTTFGKGAKLSAGEFEDYRNFTQMLKDDILDILAERATISRDEIATRWERRDWWLRADEAVKLGFADRVE